MLPKQGYFYRSWVTVFNLIVMAKDLKLDEHHEIHRSRALCGSSTGDCTAKIRVWQVLFLLEVMIGAAQGMCKND